MSLIHKKPFRDLFETILSAIFIALIVRTYLVTGYKVPTSSMAPTLLPGDFIFSYRPAGGFRIPLTSSKFFVKVPERGDLVVFTFSDQPHTNYVKRVIGLPGDKIQMLKGRLTLNDQPLRYTLMSQVSLSELPAYDQLDAWEERSGEQTRTIVLNRDKSREDFGPLIVPPNEVFVLGDHRDTSDDSRYWGTVPIERIEGRVFVIWLSLDWQNSWAENRFPRLRVDRLFTPVH